MGRRTSIGLRETQPIGIDVPIVPFTFTDPIVAVTNEGTALRSSDTTSWENNSASAPDGTFVDYFNGGFTCCVWVQELGIFVAGVRSPGSGPDPTLPTIATSADGKHWTKHAVPDAFATLGLGVKPGPVIIAGGKDASNTTRILRSTDGITWSKQTDPLFSSYGGHAAWDGSKFIMVGNNYISSADGITWTVEHDFAGASFGNWIVWAEELSLWVTCGFADGSGYVIATSPDGSTWTGRSSPFDDPGFCTMVEWNGSIFVATGYDGAFNYNIMTSPDGISWTLRSTPVDRAGFAFGPAVIWIPGLSLWLVALNGTFGDGGYHIVTSPDGITWTDRFNTPNLVEQFATSF